MSNYTCSFIHYEYNTWYITRIHIYIYSWKLTKHVMLQPELEVGLFSCVNPSRCRYINPPF